MNDKVKPALGLNTTFESSKTEVKRALQGDFYMKSVTDQSNVTNSYSLYIYLFFNIKIQCFSIVEYLLNFTDVKVYVFNGQLDAWVPTTGTYMILLLLLFAHVYIILLINR